MTLPIHTWIRSHCTNIANAEPLFFRSIAGVLIILILPACVHAPESTLPPPSSQISQCKKTTKLILDLSQKNYIEDAQYSKVEGFPTYRTNRFWSGFIKQPLTTDQHQYLRRQLHNIGMESLDIEWSNMPFSAQRQLTQKSGFIDFEHYYTQCNTLLWQASLSYSLTENDLNVEDNYSLFLRSFGLYPLTKWFVLPSMKRYQSEMRELIENENLASDQSNLHYRLQESAISPAISQNLNASLWIQDATKKNPLSIPKLSNYQLQQLTQYHAPQFHIGQESSADKIGAAQWKHGKRRINTAQPSAYFHSSYIRYQNQNLLQLNYHVWFSERPKTSAMDLYGGPLDGLIWRVTLLPDGSVLFYDTIHPCGCYHTVHIPTTSPLHTKVLFDTDKNQHAQEPILFFTSPLKHSISHPILAIQPHTHYLIHITENNGKTGIPYSLKPYNQLRSLPFDTFQKQDQVQKQKSWFDYNGLISDSRRLERFFLWPLGVPSAGAMRQQGHHAIAFIGRRHFDEPSVESLLDLQSRYFEQH